MGALRDGRKPRQVPPRTDQARGTNRTASLKFSGQSPVSAAGLLSVQALAGNRAATRLAQGNGGHLAVQREGGGSGVGVQEREAPSLQEQVDQFVAGHGPPVEEGALPAPQNVEKAKEEVSGAQSEVGDLGVGRGGPLEEWVRREQGGAGGAEQAVSEIQESRGDLNLDSPSPQGRTEPTKLSRGQRFKKAMSNFGTSAKEKLGAFGGWAWGGLKDFGNWASGGLKGLGKSIAGAFDREGRHDKAAMGAAAGGIGAPLVGHAGDVMTVGSSVVDNPATNWSANLVGGSGAVDKLQGAGSAIGHTGSEASSAGSNAPTLEHPGDFAHSFTAGGFELAHSIASVAGLFFSALKAAFDIRSLVSSIRVIRGLKKAKQDAIGSGASPNLVHAVDYAIRQKYEKVIKRAIGAAAALATVGVGLAILIANPVGAGLAAMILGGIGAGVFLYKLGRFIYKKIRDRQGKKRGDMARLLFNQLRTHDALARDAVRALHLDPDTLADDPKGYDKIFRKLKSA